METNLSQVKATFKTLCSTVKIKPLDFNMASHPFTNSIYSCSKTRILILTNPEDYNEWETELFNLIDRTESVIKLFFLLNKPYLLTALKFVKPYLSLADFSNILSYAWTLSENPNKDVNVSVNTLIKWFKEADKLPLMDKEEYITYQNLPNELVLYRGISTKSNPKGISWTRNLETAKWFANRFSASNNYILKAKVTKKDMLCYFNSRNEDEVIINTKNIKTEKIRELITP